MFFMKSLFSVPLPVTASHHSLDLPRGHQRPSHGVTDQGAGDFILGRVKRKQCLRKQNQYGLSLHMFPHKIKGVKA